MPVTARCRVHRRVDTGWSGAGLRQNLPDQVPEPQAEGNQSESSDPCDGRASRRRPQRQAQIQPQPRRHGKPPSREVAAMIPAPALPFPPCLGCPRRRHAPQVPERKEVGEQRSDHGLFSLVSGEPGSVVNREGNVGTATPHLPV